MTVQEITKNYIDTITIIIMLLKKKLRINYKIYIFYEMISPICRVYVQKKT